MEKKTVITIFSIVLAFSLTLNLLLFFTISTLDSEWENLYYDLDTEWCVILNQENEIINDFIEQLRYYDEEYNQISFIEMTECFS